MERIEAAYFFVLYLETAKKRWYLISRSFDGENNALNCLHFSETTKKKKNERDKTAQLFSRSRSGDSVTFKGFP